MVIYDNGDCMPESLYICFLYMYWSNWENAINTQILLECLHIYGFNIASVN